MVRKSRKIDAKVADEIEGLPNIPTIMSTSSSMIMHNYFVLNANHVSDDNNNSNREGEVVVPLRFNKIYFLSFWVNSGMIVKRSPTNP
jgi:hypothetical protein